MRINKLNQIFFRNRALNYHLIFYKYWYQYYITSLIFNNFLMQVLFCIEDAGVARAHISAANILVSFL